MKIWDIFLLEMKRKRKEYTPRTLAIIIPLLVLFIGAFLFVTTTSYVTTAPVYSIQTDSAVVLQYLDESLFTAEPFMYTRGTLSVLDRSSVVIVEERTLAQRAAAESLRNQLRLKNKLFLDEQGYLPPVLLNISTRFREEVVTQEFGAQLPTQSPLDDDGVDQEQEDVAAVGTPDDVSALTDDAFDDAQDEVVVADAPVLVQGVVEESDEIILSGVDDLNTLAQIRHVFVVIALIVVLNFFSVLYASSIFQEKLSHRSALLFVSPLRKIDVIIGKMLPYILPAMLLLLVILVIGGMPLQFMPMSALFVLVSALFYFAIGFLAAIFARSHKEFSFLSVFFISVVSLYLIIPAFVANFSLISNASLLTPLVLFAQGIDVSFQVSFFLLAVYGIISLWIFYIASLLFSFEEFYSVKSISSKLVRTAQLYIANFWHAGIFSFFTIPLGWLVQVLLIVILLVAQVPFAFVFVVLIAAFIEEMLRNLAIYAAEKNNLVTLGKSGVLFSLASGIGFGIAEKMLLFIMVAPFIEGYELLVLGTFVVPLLLHSMLTYLFLVLRKLGVSSYLSRNLLLTVVHAGINFFILGVMT